MDGEHSFFTGKKIILLLQIIVVALIAFSALLFLFPIDLERFRQPITEKIQAATGRSFVIEGDLTLRMGLSPTLTIGKIGLYNVDWARRKKMLELGEVEVTVDLWAMLAKELEISSIDVHDLTLYLSTHRDGRASWEFTPEASAKDTKTPQENASDSSTTASNHIVLDNGFHITRLDAVNFHGVTAYFWPGEDRDLLRFFFKEIAFDEPDLTKLQAQINAKGQGLLVDIVDNITLKTGRFTMTEKGKAGEEFVEINQVNFAPDPKGGKLQGTLGYGNYTYKLDSQLSWEPSKLTAQIQSLSTPAGVMSGVVSLMQRTDQPLLVKAELSSPDIAWKSDDAPGQDKWKDSPFPDERLLPVDFLLSLQGQKLMLDDLTLSNVSMEMGIRRGLMSLNKLDAGVMDGTIHLEGGYSIEDSPAVADARLTLAGISLDKLKAQSGITSELQQGALFGEFALNASGKTFRKLMTTLTGKGVLYGSSLQYPLTSDEALKNKFARMLTGEGQKDAIHVSCIMVDLSLENSRYTAKKLAFETQGAHVLGEASYNATSKRLEAVLQPKAKFIGLSDLVVTPMRISGTMGDLSLYPDPKGVLKTAGLYTLGTVTGVGLAGMFGLKVLDKLGVNTDTPCQVPPAAKTTQ